MQRITDWIVARVIADDLDIEIVGRLDPQRSAHADGVDRTIGALLEGRVRFLEVAVALAAVERDAQADLVVNQRDFGRALQLVAIVIAIAGGEIAIGALERGRTREDADRAAGGVAAEQGTLRPAHHFDPVKIVKLQTVRVAEGLADFVDVDADRRGGVRRELVRHADAAQREVGRGFAVLRADLQVRHDLAKVVRGRDPARCQLGGTDRRDRDRHVLQVFAALGRGDDDVTHPVFVGLGSLRRSALSEGRRGGDECRAGQQASSKRLDAIARDQT